MDAEFIESNKQRAQESIDAQIISLETKVLQLKKRRNDLSPVSALPGELLSSVFRACIGEGHPTAQRRTLATITWVSATWRDVALSDAFLWSAIHSTFGSKWMGTYVERSRNAPITLEWQDLTLTSAMRREANVMLGSQAKRMTSIAVVCGPTTAVDLAGMLSSPVPLLKKLQISVVHGWPEPVLETGVLLTGRLPHIEAPLLQFVEFLNCAIPWNSSAYRTITSIDITFEDCAPPFTSRELYTGLKNLSPRLQELTLHFDISFDKLNDTNLGPIPLPALEYLSLGKAEDEAYDSMGLLPFLHLPTSVILHLRCDWSDLGDVGLMCSGLSTSWVSAPLSKPSHPPIIESLAIDYKDDGNFLFSGWRHHTDGERKGNRVTIFSDAEELDDVNIASSPILRCLPLQNLVALRLTDPCGEFDMWHIFSNLPLLEAITFSQYVAQVTSFANRLLKDETEASTGAGLEADNDTRLPSLKELTLDHLPSPEASGAIERLANALNVRSSRGKGSIKAFTLNKCGSVSEDILFLLRDGPGVDKVVCID